MTTGKMTAMADAAPQTEGNEARRRAMLQAAAELISERGFGETRIADVAKRAGTSSGLVIYYFGTRDRLLVDALRFSEEAYYETATALLDEEHDFRKRLSMLVEWSCVPELPGRGQRLLGPVARPVGDGAAPPRGGRGPRRARRPLARPHRAHRPRGQEAGAVDADIDLRRFALTFTVVLDGLSTQVALGDREITSDVAFDIAMEYAEQRLGLAPSKRRAKVPARKGSASR